MATNHDIVAAVPPDGGAAVGKTALRNAITKRTAYVIADAENPSNLICVDPVTGAAVLDLLYQGRVFHYDATDGTTAADGVSCLVSNEGRRYKLSVGTDVVAYAVIDNTHTAPPASPTLGDSYLVAAAATGAWAGKDNLVAVWTARGWSFVIFGIGRLIYLENLDAYAHRNVAGTWVLGFGNLTIGANSVPLSAAINFGKRVIIENQTTTAPPGTASVGTAYIIGPSATGGWAGQDGKVAICEVVNTFTIYTPSNGWAAYDKALNNEFRYSGSAWLSAAGSWINRQSLQTAGSGSTTAASGTTGYAYSSSTAPTTAQRRMIDTAGITYTAKKTGAVLRFRYDAACVFQIVSATFTATDGPIVIALYRDSVVSAIDWRPLGGLRRVLDGGNYGYNFASGVDANFEVAAPDASSHTYQIAIHSVSNISNSPYDATILTRRLFTVEEAA